MFRLISSSPRLRRRATHRKSTWRAPEHIHRHGGIQIDRAVAHHRNRAGGGGGVASSVLYRVGEQISSRTVHIHRSRDHDLIGDISVPHIVSLDAGLRPGLTRLACDGGSPEQFQFGIRRVWLD